MTDASRDAILVRGARQNNLKNLDLDIPLNELIVVTGVSGSGKSSLVFDTLYAEGQRRYVETFSPYARQFLDRMDKPQVDRIERIPPAIAIDQVNPVRTSRSTVGTMTEINDHLKLLYARAARLHCRACGRQVRRDSAQSIADALPAALAGFEQPLLLVCFPVPLPPKMKLAELRAELEKLGYVRIHAQQPRQLTVIQDRLRLDPADRSRLVEALEVALRSGHGRVSVHVLDASAKERMVLRYSSDLHCADCDLHYQDPSQGLFSFNSPIGACDICRGFGRVIGIDYGLVVPDDAKSLAAGAVRPWQTPSYKECQDDLLRFARKRGIDVTVPWRDLSAHDRQWVIDGEGPWQKKVWYGARRFFEWLETKAYKMHVRVLLSRYRSYTLCEGCHGARLKPDALLWRLGTQTHTHAPAAAADHSAAALPGLAIHQVMQLSIERCRAFFDELTLPKPLDQAADLLLGELRTRLRFLCDVGLDYLTLDRQSRTLSGGEVQRIIDRGPGGGEHGGRIVCYGTPAEVMAHRHSATGAWLAGRRSLPPLRASDAAPGATAAAGAIRIIGAAEHNLRHIDVELPLHRLVCLTGVSGSGKSTLVQHVLYPALQKAHGKPSEAPGRFERLVGAELVEAAVLIDQTPIGRTTRSNPASYVGAFDEIRARFAAEPEAKLRKYTAGTFSFNSGNGRCPTCGGNEFEHVEMQFLSDLYLRCGDCNGTRYRAETLQVRIEGANARRANIAEVLAMTATEALEFFADNSAIGARLQPLVNVGLDYVRLGQPVPTLSGGEAQRLKLAGHLAAAALDRGRAHKGDDQSARGKLLIFDEPTTGLHFEDIARLVHAFGLLLKAGHSLLVIEHNLDVIRAADWVIDLGPEGGERGGELIAAATPAELAREARSHTGRALAQYAAATSAAALRFEAVTSYARAAKTSDSGSAVAVADSGGESFDHNSVVVRGAREHNLKNVNVEIPRDRFTVITGVSGSGQSTLAFDILFNEGQRRYLESLNAYARQFVQPATRPDVDAIYGIPPTVAIEQRTSRGGRKSTVATLTEIYHFLRLLWVKLGIQHCIHDGSPVKPQSVESIAAQLLRDYRGQHVGLLAPLVVARKGVYTDIAKWAKARGHTHLRVDGEFMKVDPWPRLDRFKEHTLELPVGDLVIAPEREAELRALLAKALDSGKGVMHLLTPLDGLTEAMELGHSTLGIGAVKVFSTKRACPTCGTSYGEPDPRMFSYNSKHGWCPGCVGTGLALTREQRAAFDDSVQDENERGREQAFITREPDAEELHDAACPDCHGARLAPAPRAIKFEDQAITDVAQWAVSDVRKWVETLHLVGRDAEIARDVISEIRSRLVFLEDVGLNYLTLDRAAPTLSGGEAQRIRLAAQLGSNLQGVCYVLDEPTIGLHPRDNKILLDALARLGSQGNTLVVVEHDEDTIRRADHLIDIGPGAGKRGGRLVAEGTAADLSAVPDSVTGRCLAHPQTHPMQPRREVAFAADDAGASTHITVFGAKLHSLQGMPVRVPLQRLVAITGVSGSGKSTLARDVLLASVADLVSSRGKSQPTGCDAIEGWHAIDRVLEV